MAKKNNRQQDPNDSSDSGDTNAATAAPPSACKHIAKTVQLGTVRKKLKGGIRTSCDACAKKSKHANNVPDVSTSNGEEVADENWTYWMCLTCAHIGCGRGQHKHALAHFDTPRTDVHHLVVDIETWVVWCYTCDQKMAMNSTKKLQECVEYIRRNIQSSSKSMTAVSENMAQSQSSLTVSVVSSTEKDDSNANQKSSFSQVKSNSTTTKNLAKPSKVRGLMNLGNTCFYNSVLQCLSVTPYLTKVLERLTCSGEVFTLPGNTKPEEFEAPAVHGSLGDSGPLSSALLSLLVEMRHPDLHADTLRPQKLLKLLQDAFPQFRGNDQHDAHELLRHLLEGVRSDDLKRFQRVILEQHGLLRRKNDEVASDMKKRMKLYGQQLQDLTLGVEGIFKGQLVSIVECQDCNHHSVRFESFLDLSLPVMEDKPLPPMRKKEPVETFGGDEGLSKYQIRKRQKAEKKARKNKRGEKLSMGLDGCQTIVEEPGKGSDGPESAEESDADVEDNVEQDATDNAKEVVESGYSSDKQNTGESDGTSPSIGAAGGEALDLEDAKAPEQEPTSASPAAPASPAVSASLTASASPSPTASASPCAAESPTAPASSAGPTSPTTLLAQAAKAPAPATPAPTAAAAAPPADEWSAFHTPEHGDARGAGDAACGSDARGQPLQRCFTPVDEELRITIPESGEGSIHISPIQPGEQDRDRPVSRRGFFPGDGLGHRASEYDGLGPDFTPELENRLLSLCLSSNRLVTDEASSVDAEVQRALDGNGNEEEHNESRRKVEEWCEGQRPACSPEDALCNNNINVKENHLDAVLLSKCKTNLGTDKSGDAADSKIGWCKTLASRQQTEEGECSVISCLNQFTSVELMTGNNKVGCDACTQRQNKGSEGKTVYTNSTKMFLISSPPPVLILHLKRFMMENYRFKKLQRFVSFPLDLDIAPFCSTKCRDSPSFQDTQTEIKYSLFGIVEHTGSLNTGHYIAYIKVRANLGEKDPRWSYLPLTRDFVYPKVDSCDNTSISSQMEEKWYSISDSRVVEIAESKVLKIQAYLLFYERVM